MKIEIHVREGEPVDGWRTYEALNKMTITADREAGKKIARIVNGRGSRGD